MQRQKPADGIEDAMFEAMGVELDEEEMEELLQDCFNFVAKVTDRSNPQWLQTEGLKLQGRLEEVLNWVRVH